MVWCLLVVVSGLLFSVCCLLVVRGAPFVVIVGCTLVVVYSLRCVAS